MVLQMYPSRKKIAPWNIVISKLGLWGLLLFSVFEKKNLPDSVI